MDIEKLQTCYDAAVKIVEADDERRAKGAPRTAEYDEWWCPTAYLCACSELYDNAAELLRLARLAAAVIKHNGEKITEDIANDDYTNGCPLCGDIR